MQARLDLSKVSPAAYKAMAGLEGFVRASGLDPALLHLVRMRVSQINVRAQRVARDAVLQRA